MANFAELDQNNVVLRVIVIGNDILKDSNGVEVEQRGVDFCKQLFGQNTIWKQTSYNTHAGEHTTGGIPFRKNYAGVGHIYDQQRDAFIGIKPEGNGWTLDEDKCVWRNLDLEAANAASQIEVSRIEPTQTSDLGDDNVEPSN